MSAPRDSTDARVTMIGAGLLGRGIAAIAARAGFPVTLHDSNADVLASALAHVQAVAPTSSVRAVTELEPAVADAQWVIEAIIENLALKQQIFERIGAATPGAVLMSNSSVLPIGQIAERTPSPERTVGTHWWNPPQLIPVVEVIRGPKTSDAVFERTVQFHKHLGKLPVLVQRDVPGFVGNRLQHALWREAIGLVADGVDGRTVDRVVSLTLGQQLAQRGPFAQMEQEGLPQTLQELRETLPRLHSEPGPSEVLRRLVSHGQLGAKSGQGFFTWPAGERERVAANLSAHVEARLRGVSPVAAPPHLSPEEEDIARRVRDALWREALALVAEGVCDAATVDLVACNTIGLRLGAMAPIENADYVGLDMTLSIHDNVLPSLNRASEPAPLLAHKVAAREHFLVTEPIRSAATGSP